MSANDPGRLVDALACFAMGRNRLGRCLAMCVLTAATTLTAPAAWGGLSAVGTSFSPSTIVVGSTATLTVTIQNNPPPGNPSDIALTDLYPANLVNAATPNVVNTCGGTVTSERLRGLGSNVWEGVDPVEYVRDMRREWDERIPR